MRERREGGGGEGRRGGEEEGMGGEEGEGKRVLLNHPCGMSHACMRQQMHRAWCNAAVQ